MRVFSPAHYEDTDFSAENALLCIFVILKMSSTRLCLLPLKKRKVTEIVKLSWRHLRKAPKTDFLGMKKYETIFTATEKFNTFFFFSISSDTKYYPKTYFHTLKRLVKYSLNGRLKKCDIVGQHNFNYRHLWGGCQFNYRRLWRGCFCDRNFNRKTPVEVVLSNYSGDLNYDHSKSGNK